MNDNLETATKSSFENVYNEIIIKNIVLNEKEKTNIYDVFSISKITDYNLIIYYEYILKLAFFSSNINVLNIYKLVTPDYEKQFDEVAKCLKSNILTSILDVNEIDSNENIIDYFSKQFEEINKYKYVIGNIDYPIGYENNSNGIFKVLLFKIIPNKTLLLNDSNYNLIDTLDIPKNYDSITIEKSIYKKKIQKNVPVLNENINATSNNYSYIYKLKSAKQILPLFMIEFEFKCLRIDVTIPLCEYCYTTSAVFYCFNDEAHLCDICDIKYHEKNRILKTHKRINIYESPYQFGNCPYHPNELIENVCVECFCTLCSNCLLIGTHSNNTLRNHPLINIRDAYILSNHKDSISEINLEKRKKRLLNLLKDKHKSLVEIYSNYTSLQKRIDNLYNYMINELKKLKKKKLNFLMSLKRCILSELLIIEWMDAFYAHTKLSLSLSDFILYQKKHELLIQFLSHKVKEINIAKYTPNWIFQKIFIQSDLYIYEDSFYKTNLTGNSNIESMIKNKEKSKNVLKNYENKLESIYNINDIFNNKNKHMSVYEDVKAANSNKLDSDKNTKYASLNTNDKSKDKVEINKNEIFIENDKDENNSDINQDKINQLNLKKEISDNYFIKNINEEDIKSMKDIEKIKDYTCTINESLNDKRNTFNLLYHIFKCEKEIQNEKLLKHSHIYYELWKHLSDSKYINIIHILKCQNNFKILDLLVSFMNISNYYNSLDDFIRHVIKHEIYTLLNNNIKYHTKIKLTKLLDCIATLIGLYNFNISYIIDKHIRLCIDYLQKNEKEFLDEIDKLVVDVNSKIFEKLKSMNNEINLQNNTNKVNVNENNIKKINNNETNIDISKLNEKDRKELIILKKLKDYVYIYVEKMIDELVQITIKDLTINIRYMFYLINDEIEGKKKYLYNSKNSNMHTLTLCLDIFINCILYPYIFYINEYNYIDLSISNKLHKKLIIIFSQVIKEISLYIFEIYNLGIYNQNIKLFIDNIKNNDMLRSHKTNENIFFINVSQKLFQWIIKIIESPRYHSFINWNFNENIEKSFEKIVKEIINIDKSSTEYFINDNLDYNMLLSTKHFNNILSLCYFIMKEIKYDI